MWPLREHRNRGPVHREPIPKDRNRRSFLLAQPHLCPETAAQVHNDPKENQHEILLKKGTGEVSRWPDGATGRTGKKPASKLKSASGQGKEIGPPTPIAPANMMPIFTSDQARQMSSSRGRRWRMSWLPASDLEESIFLFSLVYEQSQFCGRGLRPERGSLLLDGPVCRRQGKNRWRAKRTALP